MKKPIGTFVLSYVFCLFLSSTANAGYVDDTGVTISVLGNGQGYAYGNIHSTRFSPYNSELIYCGINGSLSGNGIYCGARSGDELAMCVNNHPNASMRFAVASINESSAITFYIDSKGHCTRVDVLNGSQNL